MSNTVQVDAAGRMVLPKSVRDLFRIRNGDSLTLEVKGETIELRPAPQGIRLERINGILTVPKSVCPEVPMDIVERAREERDNQIITGAEKTR